MRREANRHMWVARMAGGRRASHCAAALVALDEAPRPAALPTGALSGDLLACERGRALGLRYPRLHEVLAIRWAAETGRRTRRERPFR